jgi:hypothetical protein
VNSTISRKSQNPWNITKIDTGIYEFDFPKAWTECVLCVCVFMCAQVGTHTEISTNANQCQSLENPTTEWIWTIQSYQPAIIKENILLKNKKESLSQSKQGLRAPFSLFCFIVLQYLELNIGTLPLSHSPSPFCIGYFWDRILLYAWDSLWSSYLCFPA